MEKREITEDEAKRLAESKFWETMTPRERAEFQLFTNRLCMPFDVFQLSVEEALGRPVWTHEFAFQDLLQAEFLGERKAPTMQEILELIPAEKRVLIEIVEPQDG